jgi:hypothetical protein
MQNAEVRTTATYQGQNEVSEQIAVRPAGEGRQSGALGKAEIGKAERRKGRESLESKV